MITSCFAILPLLAAPWPAPQISNLGCGCQAVNARYNVLNRPKTGYDYIPLVPDDSLGIYVAYSAKQNDTNTDFVSTSCMYVLPLLDDEVLVFGGGFGDTFNIPGGAFFDANYDAKMLYDIIAGCMARDPATTRVRFLAPHGHPDHITVAIIKAIERTGLEMAEIAYHAGDRAWIEQLPWLAHHPALFSVLPGAGCNQEIAAYESPLGHIGVIQRAGHTPGSIDIVLDLLGDVDNRTVIQGSAPGGCTPPSGVTLTLAAHGTALIGGPRRAVTEQFNGSGVNRPCFRTASPPKLGSDWIAEVEVGKHPGASFVLFYGTDCLLNPPLLTPYGEVLVNASGRIQINALVPVTTADVQSFTLPIPNDAALMGRNCYVQGTIFGGQLEFCNGLRLTVGF
ncbi:MAG: hypothetical protein ABL998_05035 [Planctomycetota bacterium]